MPNAPEQPDSAGDDPAESAGLPLRAWRGWRAWRRSRPFWAGILLILAGAELLLIPLPIQSMGLILHVGTGGVLGILIGALLIACGLLLWFNPAQRMFYAIVAVLLAVVALIATNLGGFIIGTLLGVVGGSLGFAWTPLDAATEPARQRPRWLRPSRHGAPGRSIGLSLVLGRSSHGAPDADPADDAELSDQVPDSFETGTDEPAADTGPADTEPIGRADWRGPGRPGDALRGIVMLPVVGALILAAPHPGAQSAAASQHRDRPAKTARLTAAHLAPASPNLCLPLLPCPSPSPSPSASPSPSPSASPSSPASPGPSPSVSPGPSVSPSPGSSASPSPHPTKKRKVKKAAAGGLVVNAVPSDITANSVTLTGFSFDGVATVATASGTQKMLKFSMSGLDLTGNDNLTITEGGRTLEIQASSLDFTGDVTLLTTKFSGDLLGIPLTFTPASPPPATLPTMVFTHVTTEQPFTSANSLAIGGLKITAR